MIAVLKIGTSNELVILDNKRLCYAFTLTPGNILGEVYKYTKPLKIEEFRVIITPDVKMPDIASDDIVLNEFYSSSLSRKAYVSRYDIKKLKMLANDLGLNKLSIYSTFEVLRLIGNRRPTIVCGKYLDSSTYYIYMDAEGIKDFRHTVDISEATARTMIESNSCENVITEYNLELDGLVRSRFTNINDLMDEEFERIYMNLVTDMVRPSLELNIKQGDLIEEVENHLEPEDIIPLEEDEEDEDDYGVEELAAVDTTRKNSRVKKVKEKRPKVEHEKSHGLALVLEVIGCILAVILAFSLFSNKELAAETNNINEKAEQLQQMLAPMKDNVDYLNNYVKVLENGGPTDNKVVETLSKVQIDGVLSEVVLKQNTVGIIVYLADETTIDKFTEDIGSVITVTEVSKEGKLGIDATSLNKFIIHGTLK